MFLKSRLDALSDGIFGVAMTLLILDVRLPDDFHPKDGAELVHGLLGLWSALLLIVSSLLAIVLSFLKSAAGAVGNAPEPCRAADPKTDAAGRNTGLNRHCKFADQVDDSRERLVAQPGEYG
jgi:hypothetical protein